MQRRDQAVLAALVIGLLTGAAATYTIAESQSRTNTRTFTTTSTTTLTKSFTLAVPSNPANSSVIYSQVQNGLLLSAVIQPTSAPFGQNITIAADVRDVLSTAIQVNASALDNPVYGQCQQGFATGVYVYSGHYTSANISRASQLLLYNPSFHTPCPFPSIQQYTFTPIRGVSETSLLTGYWTGSGANYSFQSFTIGEYTVVVFDAWGQEAIGYFHVVSAA